MINKMDMMLPERRDARLIFLDMMNMMFEMPTEYRDVHADVFGHD